MNDDDNKDNDKEEGKTEENLAVNKYADYLTRISKDVNIYRTTALPPSQKDIAISIGRLSKDDDNSENN